MGPNPLPYVIRNKYGPIKWFLVGETFAVMFPLKQFGDS